VRQGVFPRPVKLGARAVAWPESVVDDLVDRLATGKGGVTMNIKKQNPGDGRGFAEKVVADKDKALVPDLGGNGNDNFRSERRGIPWTPKRQKQAEQILSVVNGLAAYWPLTLRQVYYRLVAAGVIANTRSKYNDLSKVIKQMRLDAMLPWEAMEDRVRRVSTKRGFEDADTFIARELRWFLSGYSRCLVQGQENYVEVWCEKDRPVPHPGGRGRAVLHPRRHLPRLSVP